MRRTLKIKFACIQCVAVLHALDEPRSSTRIFYERQPNFELHFVSVHKSNTWLIARSPAQEMSPYSKSGRFFDSTVVMKHDT